MQNRDFVKPVDDRNRREARNGEMRPVGEVMELLRSHDDRGGRWLWRDSWVDA